MGCVIVDFTRHEVFRLVNGVSCVIVYHTRQEVFWIVNGLGH